MTNSISPIVGFVAESNRIENIHRPPTKDELRAHRDFLALEIVMTADVSALVKVCANAPLRNKKGMDVRVGEHIAPPGGKDIAIALAGLLDFASHNVHHPYDIHQEYETLHPFMDGNGRSGRALWAWQMLHFDYWPGIRLGFLHAYYYQSLDRAR